jgi:hypothetical protein
MMRKYHVRFGGGARVPEGSPALPYLVQTAPCRYPTTSRRRVGARWRSRSRLLGNWRG